jgi:hypothetical protein
VSLARESVRSGPETPKCAARSEGDAKARDRLERQCSSDSRPVGASVRLRREREPADPLFWRVDDGTNDPDKPPAGREGSALHIDRLGSRPRRHLGPLSRLVHDASHVAENGGPRSRSSQRVTLPEDLPLLVHDARGSQERSRRQSRNQGARDAEADQAPLGQRQPRSEPDQRCPRSGASRDPLLRGERAAENKVAGRSDYRSVQAKLRMLSLTLDVVAIVAAGSKPEWMPQCSQRWSLPGP